MGNMKILWFCLIIYTVSGESAFGTPYLKNSRLCQKWSCLNDKLGLPDELPPREQYSQVLRSLLPSGDWQDVVDNVLDSCYGDRPRMYTNTCTGQALMHCVVDQLVQNCPDASWRKDDACAPLTSLAGFGYMFSQSQYVDLEKNLPTERRPSWFLKNYFNSRCCNLPELFNSTVLSECGFTSIINYYTHGAQPDRYISVNSYTPHPSTLPNDKLKSPENPTSSPGLDMSTKPVEQESSNPDPLECCDLSGFIEPSWRSECNFHISWAGDKRLSIEDQLATTTQAPTTTSKPKVINDVKVVPLPCTEQTCVFKKLNILSEDGTLDIDAYSKLLDNMTNVHTSWKKAKARVVTDCLARPIREYAEECEINRVVACTLDVLSENCPHSKKTDPCKRTRGDRNGTTCQISASKYRPKHRRQFCDVPNLVNHKVLAECGISSLSRVEYVAEPVPVPKKRNYNWWPSQYSCKGSTPSTKCVLNKMGLLNKYGFMDYLKMKDRIRDFTTNNIAWSSLADIYLNAFSTMAMYGDHCSSPKRLLNILDAMVVTCPISKRKNSPQCSKKFTEMANTNPERYQTANKQTQMMWRHVFLPHSKFSTQFGGSTTPSSYPQNLGARAEITMPFRSIKLDDLPKQTQYPTTKVKYGFLLDPNAAEVKTMDIIPQRISRKPIVILPVYLRENGGRGSLSIRPSRDGVLRRDPYALHNTIAAAHTTEKMTILEA